MKSARLLQTQRDEAESKRKNMEQILIMQDGKMKERDSLIKVLTEKVAEGTRQCKELEKQIIAQARKIEEFERKGRRKEEPSNVS